MTLNMDISAMADIEVFMDYLDRLTPQQYLDEVMVPVGMNDGPLMRVAQVKLQEATHNTLRWWQELDTDTRIRVVQHMRD